MVVAVVGATGALGSEIIRVLDAVRWRPETLLALSGATTHTSHVEYGEQRIAVDDVADQSFEEVDAVFLALPAEEALEVGVRAAQEGSVVVDCSGAMSREDATVPLIVPWINPEALMEAPAVVLSIPSPEAMLVASVLGPLARAGLLGSCDATLFVPAVRSGRAGMEELSKQVVAMFSSQTPPRKVFENGLAFDVLPQLGAVEEGWTVRERLVAEESSRMVGVEVPMDCTLVAVPVFSGLSADLRIGLQRAAPTELIEQILRDGGVRMPDDYQERQVPRPRVVEGKPFAHAGRVRLGASGQLRVWASFDQLRTSATAAVSLAAAVLRPDNLSTRSEGETAN